MTTNANDYIYVQNNYKEKHFKNDYKATQNDHSGRCKTSLLKNWKLTSDCAQANKHIWLVWHRFHHRPMRKHGDNLEEKSMATANISQSQSHDKVAFWPIKYLHSGVLPITSSNTHHPTVLSTCIIKIQSNTQRGWMGKLDTGYTEQNVLWIVSP